MSSNHPIWATGLFQLLNGEKNKAKCVECSGKKEFTLTIKDSSLKSLTTHLRSKVHSGSDYEKQFDELLANKNKNRLKTNVQDEQDGKISNFITRSDGKKNKDQITKSIMFIKEFFRSWISKY